LAATTAAGVVVAHAAAYLLAYRNGGERAHELQATGHGYWSLAVVLAAVAGAAVTTAAVRRGATRTPTPIPLLPLIGAQLALFAGAEVVERAAVGVSPAVLAHSPEFVVGLCLQLVVAVAARLLLRGAEVLGARLGGRRPALAPRTVGALLPPVAVLRAPVRWAAAASRAPPPSLVA
jgi:hypothetical protein